MAIISKQIGQSAEYNLLYEILKQMQRLNYSIGQLLPSTTTTTTTLAP
jgi:hypothetical protein